MKPTIDHTNKQFGQWTVIKLISKTPSGPTIWECLCSCGTVKNLNIQALLRNGSKSCGCSKGLYIKQALQKHGFTSHSQEYKSEYWAWQSMKRRCYNNKDKDYPNYGGFGVVVCDEWLHDFECFLKDMGPKPNPKLSLDRIDPYGDYEPKNCRWTTSREQRMNQRRMIQPSLTVKQLE